MKVRNHKIFLTTKLHSTNFHEPPPVSSFHKKPYAQYSSTFLCSCGNCILPLCNYLISSHGIPDRRQQSTPLNRTSIKLRSISCYSKISKLGTPHVPSLVATLSASTECFNQPLRAAKCNLLFVQSGAALPLPLRQWKRQQHFMLQVVDIRTHF